jgi:hypothetical protein
MTSTNKQVAPEKFGLEDVLGITAFQGYTIPKNVRYLSKKTEALNSLKRSWRIHKKGIIY